MQPLQCSAGVVEPALGAAARLGRWFVGGAVLLNAGVFRMWMCRSATTEHRALPVCEWLALSLPIATARSIAGSAVCRRCGGACTGCCGRDGQVVCGSCVLAEYWSFPDVKALLGNHSVQSPASARVASPGGAMGQCKVKCSFYSVRSLHWQLQPGWAGGLWGL